MGRFYWWHENGLWMNGSINPTHQYCKRVRKSLKNCPYSFYLIPLKRMKFIGNYQNLLINRCLWFCSCGIFMRAFQTSSLSLSPLTRGPWVMRNSVSVTSRRWIEKLKVLYIFSPEKWPNPQSCLDELLQSFPPWFPIANHKNTLLKSKSDLICNFFALKYVTLASLRIIMWVLWEFCLRWSGNLFSLMTTITTSKISNVLKLHTLQDLFFRSFAWFFVVFHHCQWWICSKHYPD